VKKVFFGLEISFLAEDEKFAFFANFINYILPETNATHNE